MIDYKVSEGKYGPTYVIAEGVKVQTTKYGTWQLDVIHKGERSRKNFGAGDEAKQKAIQAAELIAARLGISEGAEVDRSKIVSDAAAEWMATNHAKWRPATIERYCGLVRDFVNPMLGNFPVSKVTRTKVKELLTETLKIRSPKHVEVLHAVISGIFTEAIDRGYTKENPAHNLLKRILPPKHKRNQTSPDPLSKEDLDVLLDAAWEHLDSSHALTIETMAYTGMRLGECLAMRFDHIEMSRCLYMVSETVKNDRFGLPKTGRRLIDLPESLTAKIEKHILQLRREALKEGKDADLLFPGITHRIVQTALKRACRCARLRVRNPHDLRHTYATILLMQHYSPAYVQKQLGHHSITMTVDIYGHWMPGEGKGDLDQALRGDSQKEGAREPIVRRSKLMILDAEARDR